MTAQEIMRECWLKCAPKIERGGGAGVAFAAASPARGQLVK